MVEVTKSLANRYAAMKFMKESNEFIYSQVKERHFVPNSFLTSLVKKNIITTNGMKGSKYIGPEPTIKLAAELFDFERQRVGRKLPRHPKAMVDTKPTFTQLIEEAKEKIAEIPKIKDITDYKQFEQKPKPIFNVTIQDGKVTMEWKEFSRLVESI